MLVDHSFFAEHGWLVIRNAVTPDQLASLQAAFEKLLPPPPAEAGGPGAIFETLDVARYHDAFRGWMQTGAAPIMAGALGCAGIRLLQDTLTLKPAHTGGVIRWHQDYSYMAYLEGARAGAVRLALSEETIANGCMHVVDGSHHWGLASPLRTLVRSKIVDALPTERAAGRIRPLELSPGDVTVHHTFTFHGSFENRNATPRKTLICHMFDATTKLDRTHVPAHQSVRFPTDADGHLTGALYPRLL